MEFAAEVDVEAAVGTRGRVFVVVVGRCLGVTWRCCCCCGFAGDDTGAGDGDGDGRGVLAGSRAAGTMGEAAGFSLAFVSVAAGGACAATGWGVFDAGWGGGVGDGDDDDEGGDGDGLGGLSEDRLAGFSFPPTAFLALAGSFFAAGRFAVAFAASLSPPSSADEIPDFFLGPCPAAWVGGG